MNKPPTFLSLNFNSLIQDGLSQTKHGGNAINKWCAKIYVYCNGIEYNVL